MRFKGIFNLLFVVIIAASIVITLPVISFASTQAVNDAAANTKLTNIYNRLGNMYDRMAATNAYLANIQTYTQNTQTYLQYIYGQLGAHTGYSGDIFMQVVGVQDMVQAVGGQVADVSSKLIYTNNYLSSIDSKTVDRNYTQYIDGIENSLNDLNNINWIDSGITLSGVYSDPNRTNEISYSTQYTGSDVYLAFNSITSSLRNVNTYRFRINVAAWANLYRSDFFDKIEFMYNNQVVEGIEYTAYLDKDNTFCIVFDSILPSSNVTQIHLHLTHPVYIYPASYFSLQYIASDTLDELLVKYYALLDNIKDDISDLKEVYASDDVIAAKEQQQAYEDQTISDFTGSGSAAASGSDATNMKNVSGAIKSGLDSGGSVSNALGVFNTSGGLWDWFSQSNYDEINGSQTRSRGSEEYIDFYNTNREELERLLMEDYR